jgi:RHS repeat-associated protein
MKKLYKVTTHRLKDSGSMEQQLTTFSYDPLGRPIQTLFPDGTDEFSNYEFGQLSKWKTRRNQTKHIHYDVRGREDSHTWENGAAPGINRIWDPANRLTSMTNAFSTIDYTYDDASQAITEGSTVAGSGGRRQLMYWRYPSGEVARLTYPDGSMVNRGYTARGQLEGVNWNNGTMSTSYAYLADGKVNYQARTNGVTTTYGYDGRGIISSLGHTAGGHDLAKRDYWRDDRDRITAWKRGTGPSWNPMETGTGNRYGYDAEGQLTAASYRAATPEETPSGALRTDSFTYDELGNRTGANRVASRGQVNFTRRDNGLNQYLNWTPSAIYYDDNFGSPYVSPGNGVMMAEGWITASFNALNQPMAIWSPAYGSNFLWFGFDPLGRCVKRWIGTVTGVPVGSNPTTYFYYDGWNMVQEGSSATVADRSYVHGGRVDEIVASKVGGLWYNHHYDAQGNCIMLTAGMPPGAIQEQYDYDAFGFPYFYNPNGNALLSLPRTRFLFTGREWLSDLRIYDYRARQYQPELGRFLQPDPQEFGAGDYNLYRYCHNDPVNKTDPLGLEFFDHDFQEVGRVPGEPTLDGLTTPQLELSIVMVPSSGGFSLQSKVDVRITSKYIATTKPSGQPRERGAIDQTKVHENTHKDVAKKWHDANQNKVPKGPFKTQEAATKAATEAGNKIKADFNRTQEIDKQHKPDSLWKKILEKDR